jgi:uncharacterized membrane protein
VAETGKQYAREGTGLSFERVAFFTDAVFAIALTLIVVGIGVPAIAERDGGSELFHALWDQRAELVSFFVGVAVIGFYWTSHHAGFDELDAVDVGYVWWTVVYLAFVAFLPFPIRIVGTYSDNPVAWCLLALNLAIVSAMETMLLARAQRAGLLRREHTDAAEARWERWMSLVPVPVFLVSGALAFVWPWLTLITWAATPFIQLLVTRTARPPTPAAG